MKISIPQKQIHSGSLLISSLLYLCLGIYFIFYCRSVSGFISFVIIGYSLLLTASELIGCIFHFSFFHIITSFIPLLFGLFFYSNREFVTSLFALFIAVYILLIALVKYIDYRLLKENNIKNRIKTFYLSIILFLFACPLLLNPTTHTSRAFIITGLYAFFYGSTIMSDFLSTIIPIPTKNKYKKKIRIRVPVLFTALLPQKMVKSINELVQEEQIIDDQEVIINEHDEILYVLIHVGVDGFSKMGHVDLCYKNTVYCYGNYDKSSLRLFEAVGDGVLFTVPSMQEYITFCNNENNITVFCYGIRLTTQQSINVQQSIESILQSTKEWNPLLSNLTSSIKEDDYACKLATMTNASFYKFKTTSYKTYFVLATNCVKLANQVIQSTGIQAANPNGICSPGGYLDYFDKLFTMKNSILISKEIYSLAHVKK